VAEYWVRFRACLQIPVFIDPCLPAGSSKAALLLLWRLAAAGPVVPLGPVYTYSGPWGEKTKKVQNLIYLKSIPVHSIYRCSLNYKTHTTDYIFVKVQIF